MNRIIRPRPMSLVAAAAALVIGDAALAQDRIVGSHRYRYAPGRSVAHGIPVTRRRDRRQRDHPTGGVRPHRLADQDQSRRLNTQRYPIADGTSFIRRSPCAIFRRITRWSCSMARAGIARRSSTCSGPFGTVNQGSQGVDWSTFPPPPIQRVEMLRDGASAQYGSDAIAGVINVILKDASEGGSLAAQYGEYSTVAASACLSVATSGFRWAAKVSEPLGRIFDLRRDIDRRRHGRTPREWGDRRVVPGAREGSDSAGAIPMSTREFFANAGIALSDRVELYGNANYMEAEVISDFFYRDRFCRPSRQMRSRRGRPADRRQRRRFAGRRHRAYRYRRSLRGRRPGDYLTPRPAARAATCCGIRSTPCSRAATTRTSARISPTWTSWSDCVAT